jgi:hypothetical protein
MNMAKRQADKLAVEPQIPEDALVSVETSHMPVHTGEEMVEALDAYQELQKKLDAKMPDAIQLIHGKPFRKKMYWRTIARAFNLSVGKIVGSERKVQQGDDWGYSVTYRAVGPNGAYADGDGACMASEKAGDNGTVHNVRAHAHTRAFTRATSNLVAFGEVGFDELPEHETRQKPTPAVEIAKALEAKGKEVESIGEPIGDAGADGLMVTSVNRGPSGTIQSGRRAGQPWQIYNVGFSDGQEASTFDQAIASFAEHCMNSNFGVVVELVTNERGYLNIVKLDQVRETEGANSDDIPF